jgi:hypothetical protein
VFNDGDDGIQNQIAVWVGTTLDVTDNDWRDPIPAYADAYGIPAQIEVSLNSDGTYTPPTVIDAPVETVVNPDGSSSLYILPGDLLNIGDFFTAWQPSWANSLLIYHPENCYLTYSEALCNVSVDVGGADMDSDAFDAYLRSLSYSDVNNDDDLAIADLLSGQAILGIDPYFHGSTVLINETVTPNLGVWR